MSRVLPWIVAGAVFLTADAWACSCGYVSLEQRYEAAENVFTAVVTGGSYDGSDDLYAVRSTFDVTRQYKGSVPFSTLTSHPDDNTCGLPLEVGVEYLFFAPDSGGVFHCQGIRPTADVQPVLAALDAHVSGRRDALAPLWNFHSSSASCSVTVSLEPVDTSSRGLTMVGSTLAIQYAKSLGTSDWNRSLSLRVGAEYLGIPADTDLAVPPLRIAVGDRIFAAAWQTGASRVAAPYYSLRGREVFDLLNVLPGTSAVTMFAAPPTGGPPFSLKVRTANIGDTVERLRACMQ